MLLVHLPDVLQIHEDALPRCSNSFWEPEYNTPFSSRAADANRSVSWTPPVSSHGSEETCAGQDRSCRPTTPAYMPVALGRSASDLPTTLHRPRLASSRAGFVGASHDTKDLLSTIPEGRAGIEPVRSAMIADPTLAVQPSSPSNLMPTSIPFPGPVWACIDGPPCGGGAVWTSPLWAELPQPVLN